MNYETLQIRKEKIAQHADSLLLNINRQMCIKINREVAFLSSTEGRKSQNNDVTHPSTPPPHFLSPFFKTFVTHPPQINELDAVVTPTPLLRP